MTNPAVNVLHREYTTIALVDFGYLFTRNYRGAGVNAPPNAGADRTLADIANIRDDVDHVIVCLDHPPYRRRDQYEPYKANREEVPPEELSQKRALRDELKRLGYRLAHVKGYEADDVIATLAKSYGAWCHEVRLVCPDKDAAQLITKNVIQYVPPHGTREAERRDREKCKAKFGVWPEQMPLYQALMGDSSDNIPGVEGIGKDRAAKVIAILNAAELPATLEGLAALLAKQPVPSKEKMWTAIAAQWSNLKLSLDLVTLDTNVPLDAEGLLAKHEPKRTAREVSGEVDMPEYLGNETPMPAAETGVEYIDLGDLIEEKPKSAPAPRVGKDPQADAFLNDFAREQAERKEAEKAAAEKVAGRVAAANTNAPRTPERVAEVAERIATGNAAERARDTEAAPAEPKGPGIVRAQPREPEQMALALAVEKYGLTTQKLEPLDLRAAWTESNWLAKSGLYKGYDTAEKVFACILRAKELGISVGTALAGFHPMEGKLSPSADLIRSLAERDPNCEYFYLESADETQATWVTKHKRHAKERRYQYTMEEAKEVPEYWKLDRWGNPGNWVKRKKEMLTKTAGSKLAREVYPGACLGLYCPEEMGNGIIDTVGEAA